MSPSHIVAGSHHESPTHPELEGKRIFLSGVDGAVGESIASSFARQHTRLVLHTNNGTGKASAFADSLKPHAQAVRMFTGEVGRDPAACERLARAGLGAFGGLDIVVNLIGAVTSGGGTDAGAIERDAGEQLRPAMVVSRAVADHARNSGQGTAIMHVCLAKSGFGADFARYAMLKSGIEAMAQDQSRRWFNHDICVYAFVAGLSGDPFEDANDQENVVPARSNFESALSEILLNAAGGRSRWLNGVTVAIPN